MTAQEKKPGDLSDERTHDSMIQKQVQVGQAIIDRMRHGSLSVSSAEVEVQEFTGWLDAEEAKASPLEVLPK